MMRWNMKVSGHPWTDNGAAQTDKGTPTSDYVHCFITMVAYSCLSKKAPSPFPSPPKRGRGDSLLRLPLLEGEGAG